MFLGGNLGKVTNLYAGGQDAQLRITLDLSEDAKGKAYEYLLLFLAEIWCL